MVLHRAHFPAHLLKLLGFATAYACALVTGTALLIGAMASPAVGGASGAALTSSEIKMQQSTEQALLTDPSQLRPTIQLPQGVVVASGTSSND